MEQQADESEENEENEERGRTAGKVGEAPGEGFGTFTVSEAPDKDFKCLQMSAKEEMLQLNIRYIVSQVSRAPCRMGAIEPGLNGE